MFIEGQAASKLSKGITDWLNPSPLSRPGIHPKNWRVKNTELVASQRDLD